MIGANTEVIRRAEDREKFAEVIKSLGLSQSRAKIVTSLGTGL